MAYKNDNSFYLGNPALPSSKAEFDYGAHPEWVAEIEKCRKNILHFAESYFYIVVLDEGRQKIKLHPYQKRVLRSFRDNRFVIVLASRQAGKTTLSTIFALWLACFFNDQSILIAANKEETAGKIFKRIRLAYEELPNWLKPGIGSGYGKTSMDLANGSQISISTTSGDTGRGQSVNCLLLDELAAVAPEIAKQFWASSYPVISASKKAKVFTMSTPNGTDNLFYELWDDASKGKNSWHPERIDWWDIPGRDEKWKEETIRNMGSIEIFNTEYGNTFQNVGEASIDEETFEKLVKKVTPPKLVLDDDHYLLWDQPSKDKLYAVGVDIGEGVGQAATVAQVLDITDLKSIKQVAVYHNNKISPIQFIPKLYEILCHWGKPPALIERNNCGAQVVDQLRQVFQYDNIVTYGVNTYNRIGVQAHTNTKYKGVTNERYWINELNAVELNDINTINELKTFIRQSNGTWSARGDEQDDRVMSLIWCLMILDVDICQKYFEIVERDKNNKPARIKLFDYGSSRTFKELEAILRRKIEKNTFEDGAMPFIMDFHGSQDDNEDITELQQMGWKLE